ncbi:MAG: ATP-binding cassette domain-containing protein [Alphaproteobacteria bacterium]|nr:ATP-binding cassette domain-containing protein [Alphaproteobacteria bacterium]
MIEIIMGENGVGKTTYLKKQLSKLSPKNAAYLPQTVGEIFNPTSTIYAQIFEMQFKEADFRYYLEKLNLLYLENNLHRLPYEFSAGELQRLALLIVLLKNAPYIFLDEPSSHLDTKNQESLADILKLQKSNITVITHSINFALSLDGDIKVMNQNRELEEFNPININRNNEKIPYYVPDFLTLQKFNTTLIIGTSGVGKTTYLRNFQKFLLNKGENVAFLAQNASLSPHCKILTILREAIVVRDKKLFNKRTDIKKIIKIFRELKLSAKLLKKYSYELSVGEKQKILLIRMLLLKKQWLLLDEPTANIDLQSAENIMAFLLQLQKKYSVKLTIVSHVAIFLADCTVNFNR